MIRGGLATLLVQDLERSVRFYIETLGMKLVEAAERVAVIDAGDGFCIGLQQVPVAAGAAAATSAIRFYAKVPLAEAVAIFENRGVHFTLRSEGAVSVAGFHDPDGHQLDLCQAPGFAVPGVTPGS